MSGATQTRGHAAAYCGADSPSTLTISKTDLPQT